jgi:succinate dehydrogenase/fumarate reductase flavoprotein subunit
MAEQFEVLVIGGGGAGYTAASTAARLGKRVAMAEAREAGRDLPACRLRAQQGTAARGARRRDGAPRRRVRD